MWNAANVALVGRSCRVCLAGFALVVLPASLAEAEYGPRTKIAKNYQQWSNTMGFNATTPSSCNNFFFCNLLFQRIPQERPLIVQRVACAANVTAGGLERVLLGTREGGTVVGRYTPLVPVATTGWWAVNSPVMHLIKSGQRPYVVFVNSTVAIWTVECSISGKLQ